MNKVCEDILINQINNSNTLSIALSNLLKAIPLQATEFLAKRLLDTTIVSLKSQQEQISERVKNAMGESFYNDFSNKYSSINSDNQRKAGMFLQKAICGEKLDVNGKYYQLDKLQCIKLLMSGILYTYRNERFHGDAFSPFKSSHAKIKTYAHAYYCLLATYFFISQLIYKHFSLELNIDSIANSLEANTERFTKVFHEHLKK